MPDRRKIMLNGKWKLYFYKTGEKEIENLEELNSQNVECVDATVPGNVELDLMNAGIISDPHFGLNIKQLEKYENFEWWYVKKFVVDKDFPRQSKIIFEGLDTLTTIFVNGIKVGNTDNMFIEHVIPLDNVLIPGAENIVAVHIKPVFVASQNKHLSVNMQNLEYRYNSLWLRKAPHMYGWDIMPRVISAGIWRDVYIQEKRDSGIGNIFVYTLSIERNPYDHSPEATLCMRFEVESKDFSPGCYVMRVRGECKTSDFEFEKRLEDTRGEIKWIVKNPQLWWPAGKGEQSLYNLEVSLLSGKRVIDVKKLRIGIRTIQLVYEIKENIEESKFQFYINGEKIFILGTNHVPLNIFHSKDPERYERVIQYVKDLGCNMVRCWGGNVYEDHKFFDLCDENGILVWQDFSFSCGHYPQDTEFLKKVEKEAIAVVRKLRNHPSLVLWCGDNEVDQIPIQREGLTPDYNRINREVLKQVVLLHDVRPYIPSSPCWHEKINNADWEKYVPDQHLWGPRDYFKSTYYVSNRAHFISEVGVLGCPSEESIRKFISEDSVWPYKNNEEWELHSTEHHRVKREYNRVMLLEKQILDFFDFCPDNLTDFILASQINQAEAYKFFIEHARSRRYRCSGILWWNLIDGWPQFSDSIVDYYFNKKLAYNYIKTSQKSVIAFLGEPYRFTLPIIMINDTKHPFNGSLKIESLEQRKIVWEGKMILGPGEKKILRGIESYRGKQQLFLLRWYKKTKLEGVNHYLAAYPPVPFKNYKRIWLPAIKALWAELEEENE